ncbi:cob(I)yrinic acid a,c-diamide adenosyltransferase [Halomonas sp. MCCC 1A17488]|uniref:Corrinoid adenosyltransferase n=1 Tax=Billgrantia sulfidoxydans TaxID=2733484 RepID=A0ABX7W202_9GAMM|nr:MULTISPECIES: cob(I)yrinic acid a,c-diamide adenosyltransferase [Halomonas]MCE8015805.1 cob(I)yrinic acid a,c-diamide adenosyltransferase [Halomonas sp. MCCC 1A17488]MCG3239138.1 cob(I)yrinic acid a,c-diamide adenosyltransferase [Halomonas sp. MCCC 1A17488]QPP50919.1 cob(I)yrinic acid a,c-diamide adenosyltransferase [Halomonas sp. SS10-MC5]QTP54443.1 cob(I)yrinic acid a,c-diamide adenosyltransferase [Halomonas sulfidoxydans]
MVKLTKIYTRTGDKGETGLGDGSRVAKHDLRVAAYGTVDETNAAIGLTQCHAEGGMTHLLTRIQNDLFDVGADLCTPEQDAPPYPPLRVTSSQVEFLEKRIDELNSDLKSLRSFILPGGTLLSSHLHMARTIARRAERLISQLVELAPTHLEALRYMNRLSDLLFVAARRANANGAQDVLWVPGANRQG